MGQTHTKRCPNEFYEACRDGNVDRVQQLFQGLTYKELNYIDPKNGETSLHVVCVNNHHEIVRLLLEQKGYNRILSNKDGTIAYDITTSTNIRSLFTRQCDRSDDTCFVDGGGGGGGDQSSFRLLTNSTSSSECPDNWLRRYFSATEANDSQSSDPFLKEFLKMCTKKEIEGRVYLSIHLNIPFSHKERQIALELYRQFLIRKSIEPLLTLYSLETPLYRACTIRS